MPSNCDSPLAGTHSTRLNTHHHSSRFTPSSSHPITASPFTLHPQPFSHHSTPLTFISDLPYCATLMTHRSPLTAHRSPLTAHRPPLTAHRLPLTAHRSLLTTRVRPTEHNPGQPLSRGQQLPDRVGRTDAVCSRHILGGDGKRSVPTLHSSSVPARSRVHLMP